MDRDEELEKVVTKFYETKEAKTTSSGGGEEVYHDMFHEPYMKQSIEFAPGIFLPRIYVALIVMQGTVEGAVRKFEDILRQLVPDLTHYSNYIEDVKGRMADWLNDTKFQNHVTKFNPWGFRYGSLEEIAHVRANIPEILPNPDKGLIYQIRNLKERGASWGFITRQLFNTINAQEEKEVGDNPLTKEITARTNHRMKYILLLIFTQRYKMEHEGVLDCEIDIDRILQEVTQYWRPRGANRNGDYNVVYVNGFAFSRTMEGFRNNGRYDNAFKENSIQEICYKLFKKILKYEYALPRKVFTSFKKVNPLIQLAVLQCGMFLKSEKERCSRTPRDFNRTTLPSRCNLFPSRQEYDSIATHINAESCRELQQEQQHVNEDEEMEVELVTAFNDPYFEDFAEFILTENHQDLLEDFMDNHHPPASSSTSGWGTFPGYFVNGNSASYQNPVNQEEPTTSRGMSQQWGNNEEDANVQELQRLLSSQPTIPPNFPPFVPVPAGNDATNINFNFNQQFPPVGQHQQPTTPPQQGAETLCSWLESGPDLANLEVGNKKMTPDIWDEILKAYHKGPDPKHTKAAYQLWTLMLNHDDKMTCWGKLEETKKTEMIKCMEYLVETVNLKPAMKRCLSKNQRHLPQDQTMLKILLQSIAEEMHGSWDQLTKDVVQLTVSYKSKEYRNNLKKTDTSSSDSTSNPGGN